MSLYNPVLEETRHYYPFLLQYGFDWRTGRLEPKILHDVIKHYLGRHIRQDASKKGGSANEMLEVLIKRITDGCGKDVTGTDSGLTSISAALEYGNEAELHIGLTNTTLNLKRFGRCVGIRVTDARGEPHKVAMEIFEGMASLEGGLDSFAPFIHSRCITVSHNYGSHRIDVSAELASAKRYVPDVEWRTDAEVVAKELRDDYVNNDHRHGDERGVEVGRYHGVPISARILFGKEEYGRIWRRGTITRDGVKMTFDTESSDHPHIRYVVRTADDNNHFEKWKEGIDYKQEQFCHERLAHLLMNGFSARDLAETIAHNPHWVRWEEREEAAAG